MIEKICKECSRTFPVYNTVSNLCQVCAYNKYAKLSKPITRVGKKTKTYNKWRNEVAIPYLDKHYGRKCAICSRTGRLDVDHIEKRKMGGAPSLSMNINNVRYLCRPCHIKAT